MKYTLLFVSALSVPVLALGAMYRPTPLHSYKYYDCLDYTTWDFASYENIPSKSFRGYLDARIYFDPHFSIYFSPKALAPQFDNTKLIPLDTVEAHIKRINQLTFSKYEKEQAPVSIEPTPQALVKPEKRIVSQAGGLPPPSPSSTASNAASPLVSKQRSALPLSPEDVLLFLKKKIPSDGDPNVQHELTIPFQTPGALYQTYRPLPSQATYTQQ